MTSASQTTPTAEAISTRLLALALAAPEGSAFRRYMARAAADCVSAKEMQVDASIADAARTIWREALQSRLDGKPYLRSLVEGGIEQALASLSPAAGEGDERAAEVAQ